MADFTALKTAIQNAIKQNGNEEITGNLLQEVLLAIVTTLGDGSINDLITALGSEETTRGNADTTLQQNIDAEAQARQLADSTLQGGINTAMQAINAINNAITNGCVYAGIATPSSTPASGKVFYLALTAGTYTNYGGLEVSQGINILKNNGSAWSLDAFVGIDDTPTPSSNKLVKSGGVLNDIMTNGSAFDLTAYNNGTTYADLNAALTALNALPAAFKKGGMSMKFVLTSDNKYVQYRLTADDWSTNTEVWAIDDGGVYVENPEFVKVYTDNDNKILWAIKADGDIYFGVGVPTQIKNYILSKIAELSLDEYEDIVTFLDGMIDEKPIFSNKKVSIIGDSISTFTGYIPDGYPSWYPNEGDRSSDVTSVDDTWWKQLLDATGSTLEVNASYSGSTASNTLVGFSSRVPLLGSPDTIIIELGTNDSLRNIEIGDIDFTADSYDLSKFAPAYIKGIKDIIDTYPSARILCLAFDMGVSYQNAIKTIANHYGADYIYVGDISDVHPNKAEMSAVYEKVYNFGNTLSDILNRISGSLNRKVDIKTGKALIDAEFATGINYVENVEFAAVYLDNDRKILWGIKNDGDFYFGYGVPTQIKTYVISHMAEIKAELEAEIQDETRRAINAENELGTFVDNPEFLKAITDNENKIIEGIKADGTKFIGGNLLIKGIIFNKDLQDKINNLSINKVDKVKDKGLIQNDVSESLSAIEDVEGRSEISIDSEKKIVSYRDSNGVKHENVGIDAERLITNHLNLSESGMTEFQQSLINSGFNPTGVSDWSNKKELHINEPYCAIVNFSGIDAMPTTKTDDTHAYLEFWDMNGNYFKKEVIANAQGRSTMQHPKKNISIDICNNNDWDDDDTFNLQIGDWVPQDSFHLKAFYNDPFRCLCPVAYKLNDEILKTRGEHNDYVWKRGLFDLSDITATSTGCADAEEAVESWNTNARCFPMGFPCIVYLNGAFYGIFSWQLKKHRDNYMMSKKKTKHIHLDGAVNLDTILNANGDKTQIVWTTNSPEGIEVRNPKPKKKKDGWDLTMMDGTKYDADANGGELIDDTAAVWDATNQSHVKSAEVKQYILNLSKVIPALTAAYTTYQASSQTAEDKAAFKEVFETYFDVDNLIDYLILSDVLANFDGFRQNVQWITYNGVKWYLCAYDLDCTMGNWWELNNTIVSPGNAHRDYAQFQYLPIFYNDELEARYKELRDRNIISVNHICGLVEDWLKRVGAKETFEKEWEKWPGFIKNDNIHRLYKWLQVSISNMDSVYNYNQI